MAQPIEMPFGALNSVGPRDSVLDGSRSPHCRNVNKGRGVNAKAKAKTKAKARDMQGQGHRPKAKAENVIVNFSSKCQS